MSEDHRFKERLAAVESNQSALGEQISRLTRTMDDFTIETRRSVEQLGNRFSQSQRTPWGVLAAWAGVVLTLVGIGGAGYVREIDRIDTQQGKFLDTYATYMAQTGKDQQRLTALEETVRILDVTLQREMRLLDDATEIRLKNLDTVLQREMRFLRDIDQEKIKRIDDTLERHQSNPRAHETDLSPRRR